MKVYTCPDCGKKFQEGFVPSECPGCGCPSNQFTVNELESQATGDRSNESEKIRHFFVLLVMISILCGVGYTIYSTNRKNAEKAEIERYELREKERIQRERQEQKERQAQENRNKEKVNRLCKNAWKYSHGDPYGQCVVERITFNSKGEGFGQMTYFAGGNRIDESTYRFTYEISGDYIYVYGDKTFYYNGNILEKCNSGERFKEVSRFEF